jgi:ABC-type glycerol-3-phosphate transport system substrate-binding protein
VRAIVISLLAALAVSAAWPLPVSINGVPWKTWTDAELRALTYPLPPDGAAATPRRGVSLHEILPLMQSASRLEATGARSVSVFEGESLADSLSSWYLADTASGWQLVADGRDVAGVRSLALAGERLEDAKLQVWVSWEGVDLLKQEIARFAAQHGCSIAVLDVPQVESKLVAVIRGGGEMPDVVMVQSDYLPTLTAAKALQPLDTLSLDRVTPKGRDAFRLAGSLWAAPFSCDTQLVFYNKKIVTPPGASAWNLAALEASAERLDARGIVPFSFNAYSAYWFASFQLGFGKDSLIEKDGSIRIDDPASEKALAYLLDLQRRRLLEVLERDAMMSLFTTGRVGYILSGSYSVPEFRGLAMDVGILPHPMPPLLDFKGFAVTRKSRHTLLARRLIEHLCGVGAQQRFCRAVYKIPANRDAWPAIAAEDAAFSVLFESVERGVSVPPDRSYTIYKNTMWKILRLAIAGEMGVREVLAAGQQTIDAQLGVKEVP